MLVESFILYGEWERHFSLLPAEKQGALIMALFSYANCEEVPQIEDIAVKMAFSFIQAAMDDNRKKYERTCESRSKSGRAGGRAKAEKAAKEEAQKEADSSKASKCQKSPSKSSKAYDCQKSSSKSSLYDSESESESVSDSVSVLSAESGEKRAKTSRFTPPTLEMVSAYVAERGSTVDPQGFLDFYASKGWMVGKTPMKDWKAACRNSEHWEQWQRSGKKQTVPLQSEPSPARMRQDMERLQRLTEKADGAP